MSKVVALPVRRAKEMAARASFWFAIAFSTLVVASAGAADSQGTSAVGGIDLERECRQPYRPPYLMREPPAIDQDPIVPVPIPFGKRLKRPISAKDTDESGASLPTVSATTSPKTDHPSHEPLPVRAGPRARPLCRLCAAQQVFLQRNAEVLLRLAGGRVSSRHKPGRPVVFKVEEDVRTNGTTCIPRGTTVHAVVGPWTTRARGLHGTGRLEIQFEGVPMGAGVRVPLQTIRVVGRTLREALSWVSGNEGLSGGIANPVAAMGVFTRALGHLTGELFARAAFRTDEVKFQKGDVIRVNVWSSWLLPCDVGLAPG